MTRRRAYREEEELGEGPAIPHSRPHHGEDRSQWFPLARAAAAGRRGGLGTCPLGDLPHLGARKAAGLWGPSGTWLAGVREVSPGVNGPSSPQFPPSSALLFQAFLLGPSYQGQRLRKGVR